MSKTVFNFNTPVSAEWFNNINGNRLRFDGDTNSPNNLVDGQYYPIRKQDLDPSVLADFSQSKDVVTTNTDQIVGGNKIFSQPLSIPNGLNNTHAVTKAQLDAVALGLSGTTAALDFVNRTTNQSISGVKTFVNPIIITNGVDPNHAISKFQLDATTVKLTSDQTIAGVKTFASPVLIPPGLVAGSAVNLAQLMGLIQITGNFIEFSNGLKVVFGKYQIVGDWNAPGFLNYNIPYSLPTGKVFNTQPHVFTEIDRGLRGEVVIPSLTDFSYSADAPFEYTVPQNGTLTWIAIGY